jgi:hypothetical protein
MLQLYRGGTALRSLILFFDSTFGQKLYEIRFCNPDGAADSVVWQFTARAEVVHLASA